MGISSVSVGSSSSGSAVALVCVKLPSADRMPLFSRYGGAPWAGTGARTPWDWSVPVPLSDPPPAGTYRQVLGAYYDEPLHLSACMIAFFFQLAAVVFIYMVISAAAFLTLFLVQFRSYSSIAQDDDRWPVIRSDDGQDVSK